MNGGRQSSRQASLHSINRVVVGGSSQRTGADSQMQGMAPRPGRSPFPLREHFPIFFSLSSLGVVTAHSSILPMLTRLRSATYLPARL